MEFIELNKLFFSFKDHILYECDLYVSTSKYEINKNNYTDVYGSRNYDFDLFLRIKHTTKKKFLGLTYSNDEHNNVYYITSFFEHDNLLFDKINTITDLPKLLINNGPGIKDVPIFCIDKGSIFFAKNYIEFILKNTFDNKFISSEDFLNYDFKCNHNGIIYL